MNDKRSQLLHEKQRWADKRAAVYNERDTSIGQGHEFDPEITVGPTGVVAGGQYDVGNVHMGATAAGSVRRLPTDPETEALMQSRGDLMRFNVDDFVFKMVRTTIIRDTVKNITGWEIYNDRGLLVDWFYEDDAQGHAKDHAEKTLGMKFAGRQEAGDDEEPTNVIPAPPADVSNATVADTAIAASYNPKGDLI
jgi:hypothetical protein